MPFYLSGLGSSLTGIRLISSSVKALTLQYVSISLDLSPLLSPAPSLVATLPRSPLMQNTIGL